MKTGIFLISKRMYITKNRYAYLLAAPKFYMKDNGTDISETNDLLPELIF